MTYWPPVFNELLTLRIPAVVLLFAFFTSTTLLSQTTERAADPASLSSASAIFILPTQHQKIERLKEEITISPSKSKKRLRTLLRQEQTEIDSFQLALQEAVANHYTFTDYQFLTDTSMAEWMSKIPADKTYFIIRRAKTESGADALVMYDMSGKRLARPIPYYAKIFRFSSLIDAFFGQANYTWKDLDKVVARWSERLENFYE